MIDATLKKIIWCIRMPNGFQIAPPKREEYTLYVDELPKKGDFMNPMNIRGCCGSNGEVLDVEPGEIGPLVILKLSNYL